MTFVTDAARVDLNSATKEMLSGLFSAVGASPDDAANYADRILGWRNKGVVAGQNAEASLYKSAGYAYAPRQAKFQNALELSLLLGLPAEIVERVLPFVTIFSGQGEIDVRVADYPVLSALPDDDARPHHTIAGATRATGARRRGVAETAGACGGRSNGHDQSVGSRPRRGRPR